MSLKLFGVKTSKRPILTDIVPKKAINNNDNFTNDLAFRLAALLNTSQPVAKKI